MIPKKTVAMAFTIIGTLFAACQSAVPATQPSFDAPRVAEPASVEAQSPAPAQEKPQALPSHETSTLKPAPKLDTPATTNNMPQVKQEAESVSTGHEIAEISQEGQALETPSEVIESPIPATMPEPAPSATSLPQAQQPAPTPEPVPTPEAVSVPNPEPTAAPQIVFGNNINEAAHLFTLPGALGQDHSLETFRGDKNVVLVFYRAFW